MHDITLDFIAGFIDADGSFQLSLDKAPENAIGFTPKMRIDITNTDKQALEFVKKSLNVGFIKKAPFSLKGKDKYIYQISSYKDCYKIIQLLKPRFFGSAAIASVIFEAALNLSLSHETKNKNGLAQYIHLMYKINSKGRSRKMNLNHRLSLIGGNNVLFDESLVSQPILEELPSNEYIVGYSQGDGSFYMTINKEDVTRFAFSLIDGHKSVLDKIRLAFGNCGRVYTIDPRTSDRNQLVYRYQVDTQNMLRDNIVPVYDNNMLIGRQRERFFLWKKGLFLQEAKSINYKKNVKDIWEKLKQI